MISPKLKDLFNYAFWLAVMFVASIESAVIIAMISIPENHIFSIIVAIYMPPLVLVGLGATEQYRRKLSLPNMVKRASNLVFALVLIATLIAAKQHCDADFTKSLGIYERINCKQEVLFKAVDLDKNQLVTQEEITDKIQSTSKGNLSELEEFSLVYLKFNNIAKHTIVLEPIKLTYPQEQEIPREIRAISPSNLADYLKQKVHERPFLYAVFGTDPIVPNPFSSHSN